MKARVGNFVAVAAAFVVGTAVAHPPVAVAAAATPGFVLVGDAGWASFDYLAAHQDAIPGMHYDKGVVTPVSAEGCNRDVCIYISGKSMMVYHWWTQALGNVGCQEAYFDYGGRGKTVMGPNICPDSSAPGVYWDHTGPTGHFDDQTQLCNTWTQSSGRPCEWVYA